MIVLVPAYQPGRALVDLLDALTDHRVVVVDDGSGPAYAPVFAMAAVRGAEVVTHPVNRGKAAALRTGFAHIAAVAPGQAVVCADSDGQHRPADIARVGAALEAADATGRTPDLVLGARGFTGVVPLRSRLGNAATRRVFAALTGRALRDTQTGLRGYPADRLDWALRVPGQRFAYEQQVLLAAIEEDLAVVEVDIETVYLADNASSHFRPVRDSLAVYRPLLRHAAGQLGRFGVASLAGWGVDMATFAVFVLLGVGVGLGGGAVAAQLAARPLSAAVNFALVRTWVFAGPTYAGRIRPPLAGALARYTVLAAVNLAAGLVVLHVLVGLGVWALPAKVAADTALFAACYVVQRHWWGRRRRPRTDDLTPGAAVATVPVGASSSESGAGHRRPDRAGGAAAQARGPGQLPRAGGRATAAGGRR